MQRMLKDLLKYTTGLWSLLLHAGFCSEIIKSFQRSYQKGAGHRHSEPLTRQLPARSPISRFYPIQSRIIETSLPSAAVLSQFIISLENA